ncbi:hypothetical protein [Bacillus sp. DE0042]|uniref:hypothetical protein n=1 Tax=Bacillus sp. DE0042 TaxID=2584950 RepID=UPI0011A2DAD7|nr:hypothetical protein [Bacillus sp. DE0042]
MSNYYYDRSQKCYQKNRKKCDCECHCEPRYQTYTSGPLFRNTDTDFIQVSALNQTDELHIPQDPVYVVRVTVPVDLYVTGEPFAPQEPLRPVIVNTYFAGVSQQGNTVLNGQFTPGNPHQPQVPS